MGWSPLRDLDFETKEEREKSLVFKPLTRRQEKRAIREGLKLRKNDFKPKSCDWLESY